MKLTGSVWKFDHNVDTDLIVPGKYLFGEMALALPHVLEAIEPSFPKEVKKGDIIVGGRNFGCGSSREKAPRALKTLGVDCVIAISFARIFYRNCIAIGLPVLTLPELWERVDKGDRLEVDLATGKVFDVTKDLRVEGRPVPPEMLRVLAEGGILPSLKRLAAEQQKG